MIENIRPDSLEELLTYLDQGDYYVFAGGTDLMIRKRQWQGAERRFDKAIIYLSHLACLRGIIETETHYEIMACTTQNEVAQSAILPEYIKAPIAQMATPSIRNLATIGGNVVNDASVGDSIPVFFALDAEVVLRSVHGVRRLPIEHFIQGKYHTALQHNEILEKICIPKINYDGFFYRKTGLRKASILSKLSVYVLFKVGESSMEDIRVVVGAVNDVPIRSREAELQLLMNGDVASLVAAYKNRMAASDDKRSTKVYREEIACRLIDYYLREVM
ncbi:MAG: FAD binding domain-containing protein [Clostridia bacterium]|nr:FAD binding domain-containing protein [Clostridia bacterium]